MVKKILPKIALVVFFLTMILLFPKNIAGCTTDYDCKLLCQGDCVGSSQRMDPCKDFDTEYCEYPECQFACSYGAISCKVNCIKGIVPVPGECYYPSSCFDESACALWSDWTCTGAQEYRTCIDGQILIEWQSCGTGGGDPGDPNSTPIPSCSFNLIPENTSITTGASIPFSPSSLTFNTNSAITFQFSSSSQAISLTPSTTQLPGFETVATGEEEGASTITANMVVGGSTLCSDTATILVTPPGPWWQVRDADVMAPQITSPISTSCVSPLCEPFFDLDGDGGYPGIPLTSLGMYMESGGISSKNWSVITSTAANNTNYAFFEKQIPTDTVITTIPANTIDGSIFASGGTLSNGAYWYKFDGSINNVDLNLTADINIGSRKVILLVDNSDLYINGKINLTDGQGFFIAIVGKNSIGAKGNIYINPTVGGSADELPELEGLFFTDNQIYTGIGDTQLHTRGSLVGMSGIQLQRDLGNILNQTNPSEYIEFAPDQIMLMPSTLKIKKINWKEVEP